MLTQINVFKNHMLWEKWDCVMTFLKNTNFNYALGHIILPCQVKNKRGMLQWTRDGFGLGVERNLTGFDRYHMSGYDEEGKKITRTFIQNLH